MKEVEEQLAFIENNFLGGQPKFQYIANQENITIADLRYRNIKIIFSCHAEISSLMFINYDFNKFPKIQAWYANIYKLPEI